MSGSPQPEPPEEDVAIVLRRIVTAQLGLAAPAEDGELASGIDSIQRMGLVVAVEDHFQICFSPEDDQRAVTLADLRAIVEEHLRAQAG